MIYLEEFKRYFINEKTFTFGDARRFMEKHGSTQAYTKLLLHNLLEKKSIVKLGKGVYTFSKNEEVAGFAFTPFYYGLEYALTIRGLWTQMSVPIVITSTKALPGVREVSGRRIVIRRISKDMFFGFDYVKYAGIFVPVSDLEKTLIDFIYYKIGIDNGEISDLVRKADKRKLQKYAKRMNIVPNALKSILD